MDTGITLEQLTHQVRALDGRGYKAYKQIAGHYVGPGFALIIDHVQGDPFAEPSRVRLRLPADSAALPDWALRDRARRVSSADFLNRRLHHASLEVAAVGGSGRSGEIAVLKPGQQVLGRSSLRVDPEGEVEARFYVGLPAAGRRILGHAAAELLGQSLPTLVDRALRADSIDVTELRRHVETVEDAQALRSQLTSRGLVAFVADGALLPRRSSIDDRCLNPAQTTAFLSPASLVVTLDTPNAGPLRGMGVPQGVTLVVGGGFHGKSTLLRALALGVYDHQPGDGRERAVTVADAVKVRAEDGRRIAGTDISAFINNLPGGQDTAAFHSDNASGSTSQAASIIEALELGCHCLLLDEDTSATNFMIRDARMQALVHDTAEPITPFIDRVRQLADDCSVSTVLVMGGSGDYFDVADTVISMRDFLPADRSAEATAVAAAMPNQRARLRVPWHEPAARVPQPGSVSACRGRRNPYIRIPTDDRVVFGDTEVRLGAVEQLVEVAQLRAIAEALAWADDQILDGRRSLPDCLTLLMAVIDHEGLDVVQRHLAGNLTAFRTQELTAFLNRVRTLEIA